MEKLIHTAEGELKSALEGHRFQTSRVKVRRKKPSGFWGAPTGVTRPYTECERLFHQRPGPDIACVIPDGNVGRECFHSYISDIEEIYD